MSTHEIFDFISAGAAVAWLLVGLLMRGAILDVKVIIAEIRGIIDGHIEASEVKHAQIDRHFDYTDRRVDGLEDRERKQQR